MFVQVDGELEARWTDETERSRWLVLDRHPEFPGHWIVEGFNTEYLYDFTDTLGSYRALAPSGLKHFAQQAEELGYQIAFFDDPGDLLGKFEHLNAIPDAIVDSSFPNTVNGMLPYQVQGYNMLKGLQFGVARWDTGCGKSVLASALVQALPYELCLLVVKKNHKINMVRRLAKLVGVNGEIVRGTKDQRSRAWQAIADQLDAGNRQVVVLNYEQFKDFTSRDEGKLRLRTIGERMFAGRELLVIFDEMPTKLKTRTSYLYKTICKCLYRTNPPQVSADQLLPKTLRAYMLSATPIENSPEDFFNCFRLLDGGQTFGTVSEFNNTYVSSWCYFDPTKPQTFHNLERMRLKASPYLHQVAKDDPEVAAVFPSVVEELVYVEWDVHNATLYNAIQDLAGARVEEGENVPIFSLIGTLQMMCDAPEMINDSAARREVYQDAIEAWQDGPEPNVDGSEFALSLPEAIRERLGREPHPKLDKLKEILLERHPDAQVAIYTRFNAILMPYLERALTEWGVSYGRYSGSEHERQRVLDAFQAGQMRVFLASDSGSDSIDLDAGNVVIDYNLPWKWTTLVQRHNRVHRPTSRHDTVFYYSLIMEGSVEERVLQIIERKRAYHDELFNHASGDLSASGRMTRAELLYVLTGR